MKFLYYMFLVVVVTFALIAINCEDGASGGNFSNLSNEAELTALTISYASLTEGNPDIMLTVDLPDPIVPGSQGFNFLRIRTYLTGNLETRQFGIDSYTLSDSKATLSFAALPFTNDRGRYTDNSVYSVPPINNISLLFNVEKAGSIASQEATAYLRVQSESGSNNTYYALILDKSRNARSSQKRISGFSLDFSTVTNGDSSASATITDPSTATNNIGILYFDSGTIADTDNIPNTVKITSIAKSGSSHLYVGATRDDALAQLAKGYGFGPEDGEVSAIDTNPRHTIALRTVGTGSGQKAYGYVIIVAADGSQAEYTVEVIK